MTYSSVRLIEKLLQLIQKHTVRKKKKNQEKVQVIFCQNIIR